MKKKLVKTYFCLFFLQFSCCCFAQNCETKVIYYENLDVADFKPVIPEIKNYIKVNSTFITADCNRRLHYLIAVLYESFAEIDSSEVHYGLATRFALLHKKDTGIIETYLRFAAYNLRNNNLVHAKHKIDTAYKILTRYISSGRLKQNLEELPVIQNTFSESITGADNKLNSLLKQYNKTELYLLRLYYETSGNYALYNNTPELAKKDLLLSYQFAKANTADSTEGNILNNLGLIESNEGMFQKAVEFFQESLLIAEKQNDTYAMLSPLINLSFCFRKIRKYHQSELCAAKAKTIAGKNGNVAVFCRSSSFLARALSDQNKPIEAEKILRASIDTANKYNLTAELAYNCRSLADILLQHNYKLAEARVLVENSRKLVLQLNDSSFLNATDITLGNYYLKTGNNNLALKYTQQSILFSYQFNDYANLDLSYKQMADIFSASNNFKAANIYLQKYMQFKDSLTNRELQLTLQDMERKYDSQSKLIQISKLEKEQKEKEFLLSKTKNRIRLFTGISLATLIFALSFFYLNRKLSGQKKQLLASNQKLEQLSLLQNRLFRIIGHDLKSMIIPFSRAGKIMKNYLTKNDTPNAFLYSGKLEENAIRLSGTVNNLLFWSVQQLDGYKPTNEIIAARECVEAVVEQFDEIIRLKSIEIINLVKWEQKLFTDKEAFAIIIRNVISNAVKFTDNGTITIFSNTENGTCTLTVKDNGTGMSKQQITALLTQPLQQTTSGTQGEKGSGIGFSIIKKLASINNVSLSIESTLNAGTAIQLTFKTTAIIA